MTMLERITNSRAWKGADVSKVEHNGRPAWKLTHRSGAVAYCYEDAACIQVRHWAAFMEARKLADTAAVWNGIGGVPSWLAQDRDKAIARFERLSGMKFNAK
jgi:hypothetical protein